MSQAYIGARPGRDALAGVRTRRLMALAVDFVIVSVVVGVLYVLLGVVTLGLSFFFLPPLWPIVAFFYNGMSLSSARRATPGMRAMDLEASMADNGATPPFLNAAAHGAFFYLSWFLPLVFLVTLVDSEKRFLHDILSGLVVTRRR
ncbi:MAG TPA: RDD family protein [Roseiarcus sp.]|nr:RDD family protein [Roseiarcus sp.]